MKLLICTQTLDKNDPILGFFHRWVLEFAKHFEAIYIICLKEGIHELPQNVHVYSLGKEKGENRLKYIFLFYKYFTKIYFENKIDFVLFHMGAIYNILASPFFFLRTLRSTKFIWWKTHGKLNLAGKIALLCVDSVMTAGSKSFNAITPKVRVVGHAIDVDVFAYREIEERHSGINLLYVGRITPIKKIEIALATLSQYLEKNPDETTLHLYGPTTDTAYKTLLDTKIREAHLEEKVVFCGQRTPDQIRDVYNAHDVLVHPSFEAGFDKTVLEAMATGVIPVTSIPSFKPILEPYGLYVEARDVEGYVGAFVRIQKFSITERNTLTRKLRKIIENEHSIYTLPERIFGVV